MTSVDDYIRHLVGQKAEEKGYDVLYDKAGNPYLVEVEGETWLTSSIRYVPMLPVGDGFYEPLSNPWFERDMLTSSEWEDKIYNHDLEKAKEELGVKEEIKEIEGEIKELSSEISDISRQKVEAQGKEYERLDEKEERLKQKRREYESQLEDIDERISDYADEEIMSRRKEYWKGEMC